MKAKMGFLTAICCVLASCQTFENMEAGLSSLKGKPYKAAFDVLGFPDAESTIAGQRVFSWGTRQTGTYTMPTYSTSTIYTGARPLVVQTQGTSTEYYDYNCRIDVVINERDIIERYKFEGNIGGCERYGRLLAPPKIY